jgi:hypothetical protein
MGGKKSKGILGAAIGIVAAVALPFAVPAIATAVFGSTAVAASTAAGALYGAATGALSGSITGDAGRGALIGGAGGAVGGFIQGGGIEATRGALFGTAPETATTVSYTRPELATVAPVGEAGYYGPTTIEGGIGVAPGVPEAGTTLANTPVPAMTYEAAATTPVSTTGIGSAGGAAAPEPTTWQRFMSGVTGQPVSGAAAAAPAAATGGAGLATGAAPGFGGSVAGAAAPSFFSAEGLGRAVGNLGAGLTTPSGLASVGQLAMTMYNKPPEGLTPEERAYVEETSRLAGTNREMFDQRVSAARRLLQQGTANPEQAFAQANIGTQRRFREAGLRSDADIRRGEIAGGQAGASAIPAEYARAATATTAGLNAMPTTAPVGAATLALPAYRDVERREREYYRDLASGFGGLASAFGGRSSTQQKSLFS